MHDLKTLRDLAGLTQHRAARAAGLTRSRLSEAECGEIELTPDEEARLRRVLLRAIEARAAQMQVALGGRRRATDEAAKNPARVAFGSA